MRLTKKELVWIKKNNKVILTSTSVNVCIAELSQERTNLTLLINNFNTQHIYLCGKSVSRDALKDYVINYIKKDKQLLSKYKFM